MLCGTNADDIIRLVYVVIKDRLCQSATPYCGTFRCRSLQEGICVVIALDVMCNAVSCQVPAATQHRCGGNTAITSKRTNDSDLCDLMVRSLHGLPSRTSYHPALCFSSSVIFFLVDACVGLNWLLVSFFLSHVNKNIIHSFIHSFIHS